MKPSQLLVALAVSSLSTAFSFDSFDNINAVGKLEDFLFKRQNDRPQNDQATSDTPSETGNDKPQETGNNNNNNNNENNNNNDNSASVTGDQPQETGTGRPSRTESEGPATTEFDPRDPAGGIQMNTPAAISGPQFYKIGDWVTFGWNYTSLSITPSAIDILATCTANQATYTLAVNQTVAESGLVLWDTGAYQATATVPLLTETYTLIIYDAEGSISASPKAGYLGVANQFSFGMYEKQPYVDYQDFRCPTCNSGSMLTASERQTLGFVFGMATITVLSFTWFGTGFGIF